MIFLGAGFNEFCSLGHKYHSCQEFLTDIELIYNNCVLYNGVSSPFTVQAEGLLNTSKILLGEVTKIFILIVKMF